MELQRGNAWAAVRLLERCVLLDPALSPVLRWKTVDMARQAVRQRIAMTMGHGTAQRRGA